MSSQLVETQGAEARFRQAFERLKANQPTLLDRGASVTQNNVAREAGCDPTALKKKRFPALIREIQAYIELHKDYAFTAVQSAKKQRAVNRSMKQRLEDTIKQRDLAQSILASANVRIVELTEKVELLQQEVDELRPPPIRLGQR